MSLTEKRILLVLKAATSVLLLLFISNSVLDLNAVQDVSIDWRSLFLITPLPLIGSCLAAWKWRLLLEAMGGSHPFVKLLRFWLWGSLSTYVLPSQLSGDAVRVSCLSFSSGKVSDALYSAVIDKVSALFAIGVITLVGVQFSPTIRGAAPWALWLTAFISLIAATSFTASVMPMGRQLLRAVLRLLRVSDTDQWCVLPTLASLGIVVLVSFAVQALNVLGSYIVGSAFGISLSPWDWAATTGLVALVQLVPISFGGFGVREVSFVWLLSLFGVPGTRALAYSLFGAVYMMTMTAALLGIVSYIASRRRI